MLTAFEKMNALALSEVVAEGGYDFDVLYAHLNEDTDTAKDILDFLRSVEYKYPHITVALNKLWLDTILATQEKEVMK